MGKQFVMPDPDCYIYLHHARNQSGGYGVVILLPTYAEDVTDSISVNFADSTPLSRSAPIYSYENSGPRSLQVHFVLHRDMMYQLNYQISNASIDLKKVLNSYSAEGVDYTTENALDYVDIMAREIQAAALPSYNASKKMVNPPLVSLKLGNDIFITGVVEGTVGVSYKLPILESKKYANVEIDFTIKEVIPFTAESVMQQGSFRGMDVSDLFSRTRYTYGTALSSNSASESQFGGGRSTMQASSGGGYHTSGGAKF